MKRIVMTSAFVALAAMITASCSREDRFSEVYYGPETHAIFNISVFSNTRTKGIDPDSRASYDVVKTDGHIDSDIPLGLVGVSSQSNGVVIDDIPVYERNGARMADLSISNLEGGASMNVSAFYPYVSAVSHNQDGSYVILFTPNDIKKGPLASEAVEMSCKENFETVNLKFHHIANSIGFKVCDITDEEDLRGLIHIRKVVLHGLATEGLFVLNGEKSYWMMPQGKVRRGMVFFDGDAKVQYGADNASFIGENTLSDSKSGCNRVYVVPEVLMAKEHFVEILFDVDAFDYDGDLYPASAGISQIVPLSGVIPDDMFEMGLQYTFTLGLNLSSIYRPIEFSASVNDWSEKVNCQILDFDNE